MTKSDSMPAPTWADLEKLPEVVMGEPSIDITVEGTSKAMTLRFRLHSSGGPSTIIPRIKKITIGKGDDLQRRRKPECLLRTEEALSMKEWHYGETPPGFAKQGCDVLGRGEYVISVQFLGGYGGVGIIVDDDGAVALRPLNGSTKK